MARLKRDFEAVEYVLNENNQNQGADILNLTWIERPNPNHFETFRLITFKPASIFDITIESKPFSKISNFIPHLNDYIMTFYTQNHKITNFGLNFRRLESGSLESGVTGYLGDKKSYRLIIWN